jgi:hypothetical protein
MNLKLQHNLKVLKKVLACGLLNACVRPDDASDHLKEMCGCLEQKPHNHSHPAILVSLLNQ